MLSVKYRLKKNKDFGGAFKRGKGLKEGFLFLKFAENNLKNHRFGFIVSKKISKKAVVRNKVKRRLREAVKEILKYRGDKTTPQKYDAVFVTSPRIQGKKFDEIKEVVGMLLKKAKIY